MPKLFSWENLARAGDPLPDGLNLPNQMAYIAISYLYKAYDAGYVTAQDAAAQKQKIYKSLTDYNRLWAARMEQSDYHTRVIQATAYWNCEVRNNPTPENAIELCNAIDGVPRTLMATPIREEETPDAEEAEVSEGSEN